MYTYLIVLILVLLLSVLCKYSFVLRQNNKAINGNRIYILITFCMLTLIMSLRSFEVGVDTAPYTRIFAKIINAESIKQAYIISNVSSPCYVIVCRFLGLINTNPRIMIVFSSIFINVGFYTYIYKTSKDIPLSVFSWIGLTLFYCSMNGTRQCMAIVLALNSTRLLIDNLKSKKGWLLMALAFGFHYTTLFLVIGILISNVIIKIPKKLHPSFFLIISTILVSIIFKYIISLVANIIPRYSIYMNGISKYSIINSTGKGRIVFLYIFLLLICLLWIMKSKRKDRPRDEYHEKILPILIFGMIFGIFYCKNELINRMLWFYISLFVSFIPATIQQCKKENKLLLKIVIIVILCIYSLFSLKENQNGVVPYVFYSNNLNIGRNQ